ncbi:peptidoglycan-binding protein [Streptomyces sp. NPDC058861]|uniref:peptidoglycan-binding domain-containing protein n=1 Tax=Streptomyces sp. NPDC058861 TaxID=3346653 RepID=UPI0036A10CD8
MRNRAAPNTAVTSGTREPAGAEHRGDRVFGKVAEPDRDGTGARGQDIELFDATVRLPTVPARDAAAPARASRRSRRSRRARASAPAWRSMPLPLMLAGALSAGIGAAVAVWGSAEPGSVPASNPSLSLPVLATRVPAPAPDTSSDAPPSPAASPARTTPSAPARPSASKAPTPGATATATAPAPSSTLAVTASAVTAPAPTPSSSHRPSRPGRDEVGRDEGGRDEGGRGSSGPDVADLQRRLRRLRLYAGPADGVFGESVEAALRRYQVARHIPQEDGTYGPLTRAVLRAETD